MTKIFIEGKEQENKINKPIEFFSYLDEDLKVHSVDELSGKPNEWDNIDLVCCGYTKGYDLLFGWDDHDGRSNGILYLGCFNGGFVS
jgi:hypothetical protein